MRGSIIEYEEPIGEVRITDMIVYYDEPRFYLGINNKDEYIVYYQLEEYNGEYETILFGKMTYFTYESVINGEISLLNIFNNSELFVVKDTGEKFIDVKSITFEELDKNILPNPKSKYDRKYGIEFYEI